MAYAPTTWVGGVTKVGPTNLNHLEGGVQAAAAVADSASAAAAAAQTTASAALPTPAGSNGQFLKKVGGVWVPTSFAASDIPNFPSDAAKVFKGDGTWGYPGVGVVISDTTSPGASWDTNTVLGGNIPSAYNHLRILLVGRSTAAVANENTLMNWNADVGADYYDLEQQTTGGSGGVGENVGATSFVNVAALVGASAGLAAEATTVDIQIPFYKDTTFYKHYFAVAHGLWGGGAGQHFVRQAAGMWINNVAITRIKLQPSTGSFSTGTRIILYGVA